MKIVATRKKVLFVLLLAILARVISFAILNTDPLFFLSPRNFNGRGLLTRPSWIDFIIPLLILFILYDKKRINQWHFKNILKPLLPAIFLLATPVLIGLLLNNYIEKYYITPEFNSGLLLRYILFVLTFLAINFFADALAISFKNKVYKYAILIIFLLSVAYTQDLFGTASNMLILLGLINSVGVSTVILAIGLRKYYKKFPLETILVVSLIGIPLIFFVFNVLSVSFFTIFLPFFAFLTIAIVLYINRNIKIRTVVASLPFIIAIFLNYGLPKIVSPDTAKELIEKKNEENFFTEKIGDITVKYKDKKLRKIAIKLAKVIEAANKVCNEKFGFSPNVKELIIKGIAPGGFHAEFPDRIVGNIISEKYLENCADSSFLNNPDLSANFPDPVNGILHEYSHLFGVIPYHKWWPGAEEEGWATYSATVISKLLADEGKYDNLWQPSYNYARQAEKITERNLSGKAVVWSHPNEFGGFNLWYHLGRKYGLKQLYKKRWENSEHRIKGSLYIKSDPKAAKKIVEVFGKDNFLQYGDLPVKTFGDIYSLSDYLYLAKTTGMNKKRTAQMYELTKKRKINPKVPIPQIKIP